MKRYQIYILSFCFLTSCVIDSFIPIFNIRNNSDKELRIYFSNTANIDTAFLEKRSSIILPQETYAALEGVSIFNKKDYADTSRNLYLFIFDNGIFKKLNKQENMQIIANKSFVERKIIDIRRITPKDTIYFDGGLRN